MKKKIICFGIISIFLFASISTLSVVGMKADNNQKSNMNDSTTLSGSYFNLKMAKPYTNPIKFNPGETIEICADIKNTGDIPSPSSAKVTFYYAPGSQNHKIGEDTIGILEGGGSETASISYTWFNDKDQYGIFVVVEHLPGENDPGWDDNNYYARFQAPRVKNINKLAFNHILLDLLGRCPIFRDLFGLY